MCSQKLNKYPIIQKELFKNILFYSILVGLLSGCNTWIGRQYVNTVARYNKIHHSQKFIRETGQGIREAYKDDFNKILPVFNWGDESSLQGNGGEMDKVLKKTSKVIEKYPKSKWTDDAWFLMGQSYFYRGDFFAAIENFEFVSTKYKGSAIAYKANLWTLYSYILMGKESESLAIITKLKNEEAFPEKLKKGLFFSAGQIAIEQEKPTIAIENLNKALPYIKIKDEKIRTHYILGQLYMSLDSFEKASIHFNRVIKYNPPYDFNFNAQINLASALVKSQSKSYKKAKNVLQRMLKDDKNIEYYARIYYELGAVDEMAGNTIQAIEQYKLSLSQNGTTSILRTDAYNSIANIYFLQKNFLQADLYYDSANSTLTLDHPKFESLSKLRDQQSELLENLVIIQKNDSLLMLAQNPQKLEEVINQQIKREKQALEAEKARQEAQQNSGPASNMQFNNPFSNNNSNNLTSANASFPFYDPSSRGQGYNTFISTWGDRQLTDNWRVSSISSGNAADPNELDEDSTSNENSNKPNSKGELTKNQNIPPNIEESKKKYYKDIPFTDAQKNQLIKENEKAAFKLALIYQYELNNPQKALEYLKLLRSKYPSAEDEDQIIYELAKVHKQLGNSEEYNDQFDLLSEKFPNSKYLKALKNELINENEASKGNVAKEVQDLYNQCYSLYNNADYKGVLDLKKKHDLQYAGNPLQANFDYLEAMTYAQLKEMNQYKEKLESIVASYPNTSVSENAQSNLDAYNTKMLVQKKDSTPKSSQENNAYFQLDLNEEHFTLIILPLKSNSTQIKSALNDFHKEQYSLQTIEITELIITNKKVILIKGFGQIKNNRKYSSLLFSKSVISKVEKNYSSYFIGKSNVSKLLARQNLKEYLNFAGKAYQ